EWSPDKYTDQYRENLLRLIKAKLKGRHVELESGEEPREANVVSLMERLRASLAQSGGRTGKRARHAAEPRSQAAHRRSKTAGRTARRGRPPPVESRRQEKAPVGGLNRLSALSCQLSAVSSQLSALS